MAHIEHNSPILRPYWFNDDLKLAIEFLFQYRASISTYNAYRREIERLLQWCELNVKKFKDLTVINLEHYLKFCQKPPKSWIANQQYSRTITKQAQRIPNTLWRPFLAQNHAYKLSPQSMQAVIAVLNSFFNYLVQREYLPTNVLAIMRQKSKYLPPKSEQVIRRLSDLQWSYVINTTMQMANKNPEFERSLFIISIVYSLYLRISELVAKSHWIPMMSHFFCDQDGNWWFKTLGKGNKMRDITVSNATLTALRRYRQHLNLAALPYLGETTPLITHLNKNQPITSTRHIRTIIQQCFDATGQQLIADGFLDDAEALQVATVHWLRHTAISDAVKFRPREHVRDDAGHSSSMITDKYIDVTKRERHASNKKQIINPDGEC